MTSTPSPGKLAAMTDTIPSEDNLSHANLALLNRVWGAMWPAFFWTAGQETRQSINALLNAAREEAITAWNRRALATPDGEGRADMKVADLVKRLRNIAQDYRVRACNERALGGRRGAIYTGEAYDNRADDLVTAADILSKADACLAALASGGE